MTAKHETSYQYSEPLEGNTHSRVFIFSSRCNKFPAPRGSAAEMMYCPSEERGLQQRNNKGKSLLSQIFQLMILQTPILTENLNFLKTNKRHPCSVLLNVLSHGFDERHGV